MTAATIIAELNAMRTEAKQANEKVLACAERALNEAEKHGALSTQAKTTADEALANANAARQKLNALEARLGEAEQAFAALPQSTVPQAAQTIGAMAANNESMKAFINQVKSGINGSVSIPIKAALLSTANGGALVQPHHVGLVQSPIVRLTIRDLLMPGGTVSNSIQYVHETFTNNANTQREGQTKNESTLSYDPDSVPVATIAHFIYTTTQILDDAPMLESQINTRLLDGLKEAEEKQLLKGSGVGLNIKGLWHYATPYANPSTTAKDDEPVDRLRLAMLQMEVNSLYASGIVLNPIQWAEIELSKDANKKYLFADPFGQSNIRRLWGLPTVSTAHLKEKEFLVGAFSTYAQLWDREEANVVISTENKDNFERNMVTIRAEERVALTVYNNAAFISGKFGE